MTIFEAEVLDENGNPTGEIIDARNVRMTEENFDPAVLDDGIRETVLWLRANGFRTVDSGDGKKDHPCAHSFPNVWIVTSPKNAVAETDRLTVLLEQHGILVNEEGDNMPSLDVTYAPRCVESVMIRLFDVDDTLLRVRGVLGPSNG